MSAGVNPAEGHLTSLDFDRLAMGAARSPEALARAEAHLVTCARCAARRDEHAAMRDHFRARVFPRTVAALSPQAQETWLGGKWRVFLLGLALPALALFLWLRPTSPKDTSPLRVKGTAALHVFARLGGPAASSPGAVVKVLDGTRLNAGDALRFVLDPTGLPYVLIASIDGAGQVSIYYPFRGESSALVDGKAVVSVPDSIVLDRAPGPERLFALFSKEPLPARLVRQVLADTAAHGASAIRATREIPIDGTMQATVVFEKEASP